MVPAVEDPHPPALPDPILRELSSGAQLAVLQRPSLPLVHVEISVAWAGSTAPDEDQLVAGLASSLLTAGTAQHSGEELAAAMDRLGASWDAGVSSSRLWADLNLPVEALDEGLDLISEVLHESSFSRREGRREAQSWAAWREDVYLDIRRVHERALNHAWFPPGHPSRYTASAAEIRRLRAQDAEALVRRILAEGQAFFAVAGAVDADAILPGFERRFGDLQGKGWTTQAPEVSPNTSLWLVDRSGFSAAELTLMLPAPRRGDPLEPAAALLMELAAGSFTSRMTTDLRETRGLTYSVYGDYERWDDSGRYIVEVEVPTERSVEAYFAIGENLDKLVAGGVSEEELRWARNAILLRAGRSLLTNRDAASWLGELMLLRIDVASERAQLSELASIRPADIDALAATLCGPDHRVWVMTGDRDLIEPELEQRGVVPDRIVSARILSEEP